MTAAILLKTIARATGLFAALASAACDFKTDGVQDLGDGYPSYVEFPGQRLATGRFSHLRLDGDEKQVYAVVVDGGQGLTLVPLPRDDVALAACVVGPVARYQLFRDGPAVSSKPAPVVAYLETADDQTRGRLSFVGPDCSRWSSGLEHAELPSVAGSSAYLVRDARPEGDTLVAVDPWNRATREIGTLVTDVQFDREQSNLYSIEAGSLVVRRPDLTEMARFGSKVTELVASIGDDTAAVVDDGALWVLTKKETTVDPRAVFPDACRIALADIWKYPPLYLGFLSPCAEQRPNLFFEPTGAISTFGDAVQGVDAPAFVTDWGTPLEAFFLTGAAPAAAFPRMPAHSRFDRNYTGTLWGGPVNGQLGGTIDAQRVGDNALLDSIRPCPASSHPKLLVEYDGNQGRLVEWQGAAAIDVATGVSEFSGCYAIANFDGQSGDLLSVSGQPRLLAHGAPSLAGTISGMVHGGKLAVVSEFDGATGVLWLMQPDGSAPERIAAGVPAGGFGPSLSGCPAVTYLRNFDSTRGVGTLGFFFTGTHYGDTFEEPGVSEWRETILPAQAVIYVVPDGGGAGLWYALAK